MKLAPILLGSAAEDPVDLPMPNGSKVKALLRPITDIEDAEAIAYGVKFAADKGVQDAGHGHPLFDKGMRAYTLFLATLDVDSAPEARERFFAAPEDLSKFHPDWVLWLYQRWIVLQTRVSPLQRMESMDDLFEGLNEAAKDSDAFVFFCGLAPSTQASFMRFSARLALSSPEAKSFFSSRSGTKD
jgi:hypothetical protein